MAHGKHFVKEKLLYDLLRAENRSRKKRSPRCIKLLKLKERL